MATSAGRPLAVARGGSFTPGMGRRTPQHGLRQGPSRRQTEAMRGRLEATETSRCAVGPKRQKRSDALSAKQERCVVGSHLQGSFAWTNAVEGRTLFRQRVEFLHNDSCAWHMEQDLKKPGKGLGTLTAVNSRYGFQLQRRTSDGPWAVTRIALDLSDGVN